jgi:hypothetical protein
MQIIVATVGAAEVGIALTIRRMPTATLPVFTVTTQRQLTRIVRIPTDRTTRIDRTTARQFHVTTVTTGPAIAAITAPASTARASTAAASTRITAVPTTVAAVFTEVPGLGSTSTRNELEKIRKSQL